MFWRHPRLLGRWPGVARAWKSAAGAGRARDRLVESLTPGPRTIDTTAESWFGLWNVEASMGIWTEAMGMLDRSRVRTRLFLQLFIGGRRCLPSLALGASDHNEVVANVTSVHVFGIRVDSSAGNDVVGNAVSSSEFAGVSVFGAMAMNSRRTR